MIKVENLTKSYGEIEALRGISFTVERGEIVGFLGPNGAGKSTTMKILTGFMTQTSGTMTVDGVDGNEDSLAVRRRLGYLPESNALYPEVLVYDYLRYVANMRAIKRSEIHDRIAKVARLCGLRDRVGQTIGTLSKGYKQRVGLAQALIHDPDVLLLDEPTSGLDPNQIVEIRNLIKELGADRTVILSTHNLPEVMATCTRMLIIHEGRLVADGTPEELQAREAESPLVKVVVRGPAAAEVSESLATIDGVTLTLPAVTAVSGASAFELRTRGDTDVRPPIFRLCVERGWELVELHREVLDLEGIFRKLTQVV